MIRGVGFLPKAEGELFFFTPIRKRGCSFLLSLCTAFRAKLTTDSAVSVQQNRVMTEVIKSHCSFVHGCWTGQTSMEDEFKG